MRRAFTILETLVAVLLVVLILSIVAPIATTDLSRSSLEEGGRQFEAGAMLARADAQRRGVVLRLWARDADERAGTAAELFTVDVMSVHSIRAEASGSGDERPGPGERGSGAVTGGTEAERERAGSSTPRVEQHVLTLPSGVRIWNELPERFRAAEARRGAGEGEIDGESDRAGVNLADGAGIIGSESDVTPGGRELLVATCFPDGRVVPGGGCFLFRETGRAWSLRINTWTGTVSATPIVETAWAAAANDEDAPGRARPAEGAAAGAAGAGEGEPR